VAMQAINDLNMGKLGSRFLELYTATLKEF
jgi:hypothetical protein